MSLRASFSFATGAAAVLAACSCDGKHPLHPDAKLDAAIDAPVDAPAPADAPGTCGTADVLLQGEYVDWGSTNAQFCGIFGATFTVHGTALTFTTPPNGRFRLCVPGAARTQIDIMTPAGPSACSPSPGSYAGNMPGIAIADPAVIATGQVISDRYFTTAVAAAFTPALVATDAQLFVHIDGTASAITLSQPPGSAMYFDGTTQAWSTTMTATTVNAFYLNLDPTTGSVGVLMAGATGNGSVPLAAGSVSYITLVGG